MKKLTSIVTALTLASSAAFVSTSATAEISANVAATSNYLWRGLEQTGGAAAVSGGIDYSSNSSGFYVGTWASNASWAEGMTYELDLYGGYGADINDKMSYDVGYIYFAYPDETSGDAAFSEIYGSFTYSNFTVGLAVLATGEGGDFGDSIYVNADYAIPLSSGAEIALHVGSYTGDWLAEESIDYSVSLSKDNFTFGLSATDLEGNAGDVKAYVSYSVDIEL